MYLRDIEIRTNDQALLTVTGEYTFGCVVDLLLRMLGKVKTGTVAKVNIYLETSNKNIVINSETLNVYDIYYPVDLEVFTLKISNTYAIKHHILTIVLHALGTLANKYEWDKIKFIEAYTKALDLNLVNEWNYKNKLFRSPDKQYYMAILNTYDLQAYTLKLIIYDKNKVELGRKLIYQNRVPSFALEKACWSDDNKSFQLKFAGPKKLFVTQCEDILNSTHTIIPAKFVDWFD